ncbi:hypothetical protein [Janthinobacterium sp.]|uniref:hypothetical protein n=1 Tax=Janthinobacterium sp. TaxID=1871054 RepID=UPI0028A285FA|nr:hypothetical protein [Janthinobacterium sp.]
MENENIIGHTDQLEMDRRRRIDALTAQKIDVAIIFQEMLGTAVAAKYLYENDVSLAVALRVLVHTRRKDPSPPKMIGMSVPPETAVLSGQVAREAPKKIPGTAAPADDGRDQ